MPGLEPLVALREHRGEVRVHRHDEDWNGGCTDDPLGRGPKGKASNAASRTRADHQEHCTEVLGECRHGDCGVSLERMEHRYQELFVHGAKLLLDSGEHLVSMRELISGNVDFGWRRMYEVKGGAESSGQRVGREHGSRIHLGVELERAENDGAGRTIRLLAVHGFVALKEVW